MTATLQEASLHYDPASGRVREAEFIASPNCDARPDPDDISLLVVHGISLPPGIYGGDAITELFTNRLDPDGHPYFSGLAGLRVSAHLLIRRGGEIIQYVPLPQRAWHAGESEFCGRCGCNDYAIGIELEGMDEDAYTPLQYRQLVRLARLCMRQWPGITQARIVAHAAIAPGRKTDPGPAFDWHRFRQLLGLNR